MKNLWKFIAALILLSPLGLLLPDIFNAGGAWGEWGAEEIEKISGYIPEGMKRLAGLWNAPIADYAFRGWDEGLKGYVSYIVSGLIGIAAVTLLALIAGRLLAARKGPRPPKFIDKTLSGIISFMEDALFNRNISLKEGFLQRLEPRVKLIGALLFIIALSFVREPSRMLFFLILVFALAALSRVPLRVFIGKLLPAFLFTLVIALPAMLNLFVEGDALVVLYRFKEGGEIAITEAGLKSALGLLLRVTASVGMVFLQTLTTPPARLVKAVSTFMPGMLGSVFSISYRYIFFLLRRVEEFITAYKARGPRAPFSRSSKVGGRMWAASRMGALFSLSLHLSRDLGLAMRSRGFRLGGREFVAEPLKPTFFDALWIAFGGLMLWYGLI